MYVATSMDYRKLTAILRSKITAADRLQRTEPAHLSTIHFYLGLSHESQAEDCQWHDDRVQSLQTSLQCFLDAASCLPRAATTVGNAARGRKNPRPETTRNFSWPMAGAAGGGQRNDEVDQAEIRTYDAHYDSDHGHESTEPYPAKDAANERAIARFLSSVPTTLLPKTSASLPFGTHGLSLNDKAAASRRRYNLAMNEWRETLQQYIQAVERILQKARQPTAASEISSLQPVSPQEDLLASSQVASRMQDYAGSRSISGIAEEPEEMPLPRTPPLSPSTTKSPSRLPQRSNAPRTPTCSRRSPMAFRSPARELGEP